MNLERMEIVSYYLQYSMIVIICNTCCPSAKGIRNGNASLIQNNILLNRNIGKQLT